MKLSISHHFALKKQDTILLAGLCLVAFLWFFSYYSKNQDLLLRCRYEIKNLEIHQSALNKAKNTQNTLADTFQDLTQKLKKPSKEAAIFNPKRPSLHMTDLAHKACKIGLRLDSCTIQKQKHKEWFTKQNIVYEMTGTQDQIKKFIENVQRSPYALRCKNISLKKMDSANLHIACTLQFLVFKSKTQNTLAQQPTPANTPPTKKQV